jgi:hypothetical protein
MPFLERRQISPRILEGVGGESTCSSLDNAMFSWRIKDIEGGVEGSLATSDNAKISPKYLLK